MATHGDESVMGNQEIIHMRLELSPGETHTVTYRFWSRVRTGIRDRLLSGSKGSVIVFSRNFADNWLELVPW